MRNTISRILREARTSAPLIAAASGLACVPAYSAPGDLDPSFGDVGRLQPFPELHGPAWSVELIEDDFLLAGGAYERGCSGFFCYYYSAFESTGFAARMAADGAPVPDFATDAISDVRVLDVAINDGKAICVGGSQRGGGFLSRTTSALAVFRLESNGALDTTFGEGGVVRFEPNAVQKSGTSVVVESDGRVVVAGTRGSQVIVLRLLSDGTTDSEFGALGVFTVPFNADASVPPRIARTEGGGYRLSTNSAEGKCAIVGLTADGLLDLDFGANGITLLEPPFRCNAMVADTTGGLVVAGASDAAPVAIRLLTSGDPVPGSVTDGAAGTPIEQVTALGVGEDGSVLLAGRGPEGVAAAVVVRLQASGELDTLYGNSGTSWVELPTDHGTPFFVDDMKVLSDGAVLLSGGDNFDRSLSPVVARLLGDGSAGGPGVLGIMHAQIDAHEADEAVLTVRRTGGHAGEVSIDFQTRSLGTSLSDATAPDDYTETSESLTWADGDIADQEIRIPIAPNGAEPEAAEVFEVTLSNPQGGAGIGTKIGTVQILADGEPAGQFSITSFEPTVSENSGVMEVSVSRDYYFEGDVSVTVTPVAESATAGDDFASDPIVLSWANGDGGSQGALFTITNDTDTEDAETFTIQLSAPTGGAIVGPLGSVMAVIEASDQNPPPPPPASGGGGGGGGRTGLLSLLLMGLAALRRFPAVFSRGR